MADSSSSQSQEVPSSSTVTVTEADSQTDVPRVTLKLRKPKIDRKVQWSTETVDNEHLNKKKSKCCCIYDKPRKFGESSSESSEDECDHCHGHVEKRKKHKKQASGDLDSPPQGQDIPAADTHDSEPNVENPSDEVK